MKWTDELDTYTRCISRVMPRLPQNYNSGTQIFQTPDYIVLTTSSSTGG